MSSSESGADFEIWMEEMSDAQRESLEGFERALANVDSSSSSLQREYENRRLVLRHSPGLSLSRFEHGTDLVLTTEQTLAGQRGHLRMILEPSSPEEDRIQRGQRVRAFVLESNLVSVEASTHIEINCPSIGTARLDPSHNGEIRDRCNLIVTPIAFAEVCTTGMADDKLVAMQKAGQIEYLERGPFAERYVTRMPQYTEVMVPGIVRVDRVHPEHEALEYQRWMSARDLEI